MVSCPSAPMFHTLARNPRASPIPQSTMGVAFTKSSVTPKTLLSGARKKVATAENGLCPMNICGHRKPAC